MSQSPLLNQLRMWRDETARTEGVEGYRVLPNAALEAIAASLPRTKEELCAVKGIKEAKFRRYGKKILSIVESHAGDQIQAVGNKGQETGDRKQATGNKTGEIGNAGQRDEHAFRVAGVQSPVSEALSVSDFLEGLNLELSGMAARVRGEISELTVWNQSFVFFSLKDSADGSVLKCGMPYARYRACGVEAAVGDEVIVEGYPKMYKPRGELSLQVGVIEYAGEGALKKAYDALYCKLEAAGVFAPERKRALPAYPERIALITSRDGAALGDFTMNLVRAGIHVDFYPTLVEGKKAVFEIVRAIEYFNANPERYDVLAIVRGGGSLESLQAFNSEYLVEAVTRSAIPVLAGIGHERDVSLAALAADAMVSTPTATARALSDTWEAARIDLARKREGLLAIIQATERSAREDVARAQTSLQTFLERVLLAVTEAETKFRETIAPFPEYCRQVAARLESRGGQWLAQTEHALSRTADRVASLAERLRSLDPERALRLGYSLVRQEGRVVRDASLVAVGDELRIQLARGTLQSKVTDVIHD